jgi:glycosyltransferase involved in cell wall biosynthesis
MPQFRNFSLSTLFDKSQLAVFYEKRLIIRQYRRCKNNFIAISSDTADYFSHCLPPDLRRRMVILHNAIKVERFSQAQRGPQLEPFRLVTTGNLVDKKNQVFLVDVVKILWDKGVKAKLDILGGEGPNREKIQRKIDDAGMSAHITMQGNVEKVEDYLHRADIYVHAATYEPFGLAIIEAMAAGLPCVMLDGRGNRDIAEDGKNGFLVTENNPRVFAERVERLIKNPELYKSMSMYAAAFAKKFDMREYVSKLLASYQRALDSHHAE